MQIIYNHVNPPKRRLQAEFNIKKQNEVKDVRPTLPDHIYPP